MRRKNLDLLALLALATAQVVLVVVPSFVGDTVIRTLVGLPMALCAPGFAFTAAIWPTGGLTAGERPALSLGVSFGFAALGGLVLYWLGVGFQPVTWTVLLVLPTVIGSLVAFVRRLDAPSTAESPRTAFHVPSTASAGFVAVAALLTVGAIGFAAFSASRPREQFSQLWLVQPAPTSVEIGLRSMELQPTRFRVQVLDGDQVALDTSDIELATGETWHTTLPVTEAAAPSASVQAIVYRADAPDTPYRRVELRPAQKG